MAGLKITGSDPIVAARGILEAAGVDIIEERAMPYGVQFRLDGGRIANVFTSGAVVPQGARSETTQHVFEDAIGRGGATTKPAPIAPAAPRARPSKATPQPDTPAPPVDVPSRRHPRWSDDPGDGLTCPFDVE